MSKPPADSNNVEPAAGCRGFPRNRYVIFFGIALIGCAVDLLTKQLVFAWLGLPTADVEKNTFWIVKGYVGIQTAVNQGALFGMGQGLSGWFALLSVVAGAAVIYWLFVRGAARDLLLTVALGMVSAGILGNLYDRLGLWHGSDIADRFRHGVRDWILFQYHQYVWPNFNLADSLLVCGAGLLLFHAFFYRPAEAETKHEQQAEPAEPPAEKVA